MVKSELSITIEAPPEKVFARIANPYNAPEDAPNIIEVKDVTGEGVGKRWKIVYKMMGIRLNVDCEFTEYVPSQRSVTKCSGGIDCTMTWTVEPQEDATRLIVASEYTVPVPLVGKIAELLLKKQNEREWESVLGNIKARVEAEA